MISKSLLSLILVLLVASQNRGTRNNADYGQQGLSREERKMGSMGAEVRRSWRAEVTSVPGEFLVANLEFCVYKGLLKIENLLDFYINFAKLHVGDS